MTTLEEAKAFLQKEAPDGTNLYDHLAEVLLRVLVERPENLHETFEHLSVAVRQQRYMPTPAPAPADAASDTKPYNEKWCQSGFDLLKIKPDEEGSMERPTGVADLLDEANMLEWAGIGFSKGETFRLSLALQQLARSSSTSTLRFWGKMLGIGADYYIAEGELPSQTEPEDPISEEGTSGVNRFTYWAMKDDGEYKWIQLPNARREHIQIARKLRRYVRGDLDAKVRGHPPFPGTEKHFLRAQIARITSSTVVCPSGYFQANDVGEIEPAEDPQIKTAEELADLGGWVHFSKEVNSRYGRATPMPLRTNAEGEDLPWEDEEFAPPLRAVNEDNAGSWRIDRLPGTLIPAVGEVAVLRSLVWPGAVSIGVGKKFLNLYVGHGVKFSPEPYQLQAPLPLQVGFGISTVVSEDPDAKPALRFEMLAEQKDLLEDPSPPQEEDE